MGVRKPFNKELYEQNDKLARAFVKEFFVSKGLNPTDNDIEDKYAIDLYVEGLEVPYVEVERRNNWKDTPKFPIFKGHKETVHIPERKGRLGQVYEKDFWYVIVNEPLTRLGILSPKLTKKYMTEEYLVECSNKFIRKGENFYDVPIESFKFIEFKRD